MKRAAFVVLLFVTPLSAFSQQTQRYIVGMKPGVARAAKSAQFAGRDLQDLNYLDSIVVNLTDAEVQALRSDGSVSYVESAEIKFFASDATVHPARPVVESHPTDAQVTPYGITMVRAPQVWSVVAKGDGVNVAIVDTGIDYTHPELKDHYQGGFNAITGTNDPKDDVGHGTHVAGTIAAADNGIGVVGVAPNAKIWSAKVLHPDGTGSATGTNAQIAAGLNWVLSKRNELGGHWIVNMSLGQCTDQTVDPNCSAVPSLAMQTACQKLADAGVLVFAASGNDSTPTHPATVSYPAAFSSVIAVGAVDVTQTVATFSNQGPELAVSGPGVTVFSTYIVGHGTNSFVNSAGTSYDAFALASSGKGAPTGQYVYCGLGSTAGDFPASVKNNIALIQRGTSTFSLKTRNAVAAGAKGVVIYNCSAAATPSTCAHDEFGNWTLIGKLADQTTDDPADLAFPWPVVVGITLADGETLRKAAAGSTLTATNVADDYAFESGTSMACPHAVGVAALVWSAAPNASASDVKTAILNTAADLGAKGKDPVYGFGLLDAYAAARQLNPAAFSVKGRSPKRGTH